MLMRASETGEADQDSDVRKAAFAERLKAAMGRKGWGLSETARQASQRLGPDAKFGRAHVWHYLHQRAMPRARQLNALSQALEIAPQELLGVQAPPRSHGVFPTAGGMVRARDHGDGTVFLEVAQRVSWDIALEVLRAMQRSPGRSGRPRNEDASSEFEVDISARSHQLSRSPF